MVPRSGFKEQYLEEMRIIRISAIILRYIMFNLLIQKPKKTAMSHHLDSQVNKRAVFCFFSGLCSYYDGNHDSNKKRLVNSGSTRSSQILYA